MSWTITGTGVPGATVQGYRATRFAHAQQDFAVGSAAPSSPDAAPVTIPGSGTWSLVLPTNEDYLVTVLDAQSRVINVTYNAYNAPTPLGSALDVADRAARLLGHVAIDSIPTTTVIDAVGTVQSGTITGTGEVVRAACGGYDGALVTYNSTGYTGNNSTIAFEFSDDGGTTWYPTQAARTDTFSAATTAALNAAQAVAYYVDAPGATHVRVRSTAFTVGGTPPTVRMTASTATIFSSMTVGAQLVAGSGTPVNVVGSGSIDGIVLQTGLAVMSQPTLYDGSVTRVQRTPVVFKPLSAVSVASEATIWTPTAGKKFRLMGYLLASSVAGNVTLKDNTGGTTIHVVPCGTPGVAVPAPQMGNGQLSAAANNVLTATGPAASTLSGVVFGTEE
jgi:hypothetical protein